MTVLVAQIGARRHYAVPRALAGEGLLQRLITDLCAGRGALRALDASLPTAIMPAPLAGLLARRVDGVPPRQIQNLWSIALSPQLRRRPGEPAPQHWTRRNTAFGSAVAALDWGAAKAVYGFNAAAQEIFDRAALEGRARILDQTAAPWAHLKAQLDEERRRWPGWDEGDGEADGSEVLAEREAHEWALADAILCGSDFARQAAIETGAPASRCHVVPYAGHTSGGDHAPSAAPERRAAPGPLRILYAGALQLRKGVQYLAEAAALLPRDRFSFRLVGAPRLTDAGLRRLRERMTVAGAVPRSAMAAEYADADVFVLPTLSEGSANVVFEAMAAGLPVITTPNAGSIIRDGVDGLLTPPGDPSALAEALRRLEGDPSHRSRLAAAAKERLAAQDLSSYGARLAACIAPLTALSARSTAAE